MKNFFLYREFEARKKTGHGRILLKHFGMAIFSKDDWPELKKQSEMRNISFSLFTFLLLKLKIFCRIFI